MKTEENTMKNAQNAQDRLAEYIRNLTPAQVKKLEERMTLLEQLRDMSRNELIFAETFLGKVCGRKSA